MKLQKITQKRWFWPLVCAVSVVFGWWYLSIVTCAPLGGDDELINLQNYYYITHTSFGQSVLDYIGDLWTQFSLQQGRFRPFSSPPVRGLKDGTSSKVHPTRDGIMSISASPMENKILSDIGLLPFCIQVCRKVRQCSVYTRRALCATASFIR